MADENTILTALGLDTAAFEKGASRAAGAASIMIGVFNSLDNELRKIPIAGDIYAATVGKIATGFAEARIQAREFARIAGSEVPQSLDSAIDRLESINNLLGEIRTGSFARFLSDAVKNVGRLTNPATINAQSPQSIRAKQDAELEAQREKLLERVVDLHKQEERARSDIYAGSIKQSDLDRAQVEYDRRIANAEKEAEKFGPDRAKWSKQVVDNKTKEEALARQILAVEVDAAERRAQSRRLDNAQSVALAYESVSGSTRDIAQAQYDFAKQRYDIARKGTAEENAAASAQLNIASIQLKSANLEYELAKNQLSIETELMDLTVRGQTRAAAQAKIRADYETRIVDEARRGNAELADSLRKQERSAQLAESIRQYKLGGGGRAQERLRERQDAQIARIVESRRKNAEIEVERRKREGNQLGITHLEKPGHLVLSKHLQGSLLDKKKTTNAQSSTERKTEQFTAKMLELVSQIASDLKD